MLRMRFLGRMFGLELDLTRVPYELMIQSAAMLATSLGLIKLHRWGGLLTCLVSIILIVLNLFELPTSIATIVVQAVILRFLLSAKSRRIFSASYTEVIRLTPFIQSPVATWIRPVLLIQAIALALMFWYYS